MYKRTETVCCDICQTELTPTPSEYYKSGANLDILCAQCGWVCICATDSISLSDPDQIYVRHVCPECIRIVGYAHSFGLAKTVLKKFDPQTYSRVQELTWRIGNSYYTFDELVFMTHEKEGDAREWKEECRDARNQSQELLQRAGIYPNDKGNDS